MSSEKLCILASWFLSGDGWRPGRQLCRTAIDRQTSILVAVMCAVHYRSPSTVAGVSGATTASPVATAREDTKLSVAVRANNIMHRSILGYRQYSIDLAPRSGQPSHTVYSIHHRTTMSTRTPFHLLHPSCIIHKYLHPSTSVCASRLTVTCR